MSDPSARGNKGHSADLGAPRAAPAPFRPAAQRTQERRRALILGCAILLPATLYLLAVIATKSPILMSVPSSQLPQTAIETHDFEQTARITNASDANGCFQQQFDNKTGRMTRLQEPCETVVRDAYGVPMPVGTIHRMDAISKAFSGR
jgi:hypothetical protein